MLIAPIICILIAILINRYMVKRQNSRTHTHMGILNLIHVQKIMELTQKHRGISNAVLNGNAVLKQPLLTVQRQIDVSIDKSQSLQLSQFSQWQSYNEHWQRLRVHAVERNLPSQNLLRQHKIMIEGLLSLVDEVIIYFNLNTIMLDETTSASAICQDTLRLSELVAQARGVGTGICARGECNGSEKISLNFIRMSLKPDAKKVLRGLNRINNSELSEQTKAASLAIEKHIDVLIQVLDKSILIDNKIDMEADDYFRVATQPIDELLNIFGVIVNYAQSKHQ